MSGKFLVSLTHAKNDSTRPLSPSSLPMLPSPRTRKRGVSPSRPCVWRSPGYAEDIHEEGFAPLKDLMANFVKAGGKIYVCSPCFKKRKLDETQLIDGAVIVGGAKLVEFMGETCPSVSY